MAAEGHDSRNAPRVARYWLPKRWREIDPISLFELTLARALLLLEGTRPAAAEYNVNLGNATELDYDDDFFDYILTRPPSGGKEMAVDDFSALWRPWIGGALNLDERSARRNLERKSVVDFGQELSSAFGECHRVLKPGATLTIVLGSEDSRIWRLLNGALHSHGFRETGRTALPCNASTGPGAVASVLRHFEK
jgi:hypothetical protein